MGDNNMSETNISAIRESIGKEAEEIKKRDSKPVIDPNRPMPKELVVIDTVLSDDETEFINRFCRKILRKEPEQNDIDDLKKKLQKNPNQEAIIYDYVYPSKGEKPDIEVGGFKKVYLKDILSFDGEEFVEQCFLLIMQRKADSSARKTFNAALANGCPKLQLVYELRNSSEGMEANVEIVGLEQAEKNAKRQKIKRIPANIKSALSNLFHIRKIRADLDEVRGQMGEVIRQNNELKKENEKIKALSDQQSVRLGQIEEKLAITEGKQIQTENELIRIKKGELEGDLIRKLNYLLSAYPTVWGDESKIEISPLAAVHTCFFNANSGKIVIGDYTFAGSNVSILAGSHDKNLTGLLRRDSEIAEGCDIVIGRGVWLGSNCTVLGPAIIEDDAVIAAGAVVTPGTHVPKGAVFGGVPAKMISDGTISEEEKEKALKKAFERNNGILFVDGWTEKRSIAYKGESKEAHFLINNNADVYLKSGKYLLYYSRSSAEENKLTVTVDGKDNTFNISEKEGNAELEITTSDADKYFANLKIRLENEEDGFAVGFDLIGE